MPVQPTVQLGDPRLRGAASAVAKEDLPSVQALVADLADTLADWRSRTGYGRGIAAPQIGVGKRVVYVEVDEPWVLVNPRIVERSPETWEPWDGCLSFSLSFFCRVTRNAWVAVEYETPEGRQQTIRADGELGELLQHEIDHLDGILAVDRMTAVETLCMRSEFERRHRDDSPYRTRGER